MAVNEMVASGKPPTKFVGFLRGEGGVQGEDPREPGREENHHPLRDPIIKSGDPISQVQSVLPHTG